MKLTKSDLLVLLNSYLYGNTVAYRMGTLKADVQVLIDKLLNNELEIEGYKKESESFADKFHAMTLSICKEMQR